MIKKILGISITAAAAAIVALPAMANDGSQDVLGHQPVYYSDLDLSTATGAHQAYLRLKGAAYQACRASESVDPNARTIYNPCIRAALGDAVARLNAPALSELYVGAYHMQPALAPIGS